MVNPLLSQFYLPPFSLIHSSDIECAVRVIVSYCYEIVEEVLSQFPHTWDNLCYPLLLSENQLCRVWSPIEHLYAVKNTPGLCQSYKKSKAIIVEYEVWISQNYSLYCAYYSLRNSNGYLNLTRSQKRFVTNALSGFVFSGCELSIVKRTRYARIYKKLSSLINIYNDNVLNATNSWKKVILDKERLYGLSNYDLEMIAYDSNIHNRNCSSWLLTLEYPVYLSVMKYCEDSVLREEMYWAYNTRASDQGPDLGRWDNTLVIDEILSLRYELAKLLGFNNYSDTVLINRMAKNSHQVISFLQNLSASICSHANVFFVDLKKFVQKYYGYNKLYPWDILFYIEKQKRHLFFLSEIELREYFPVNHVLNGIFKIVNCIYGISIYERYTIDVWHPDVRFFDVLDLDGHWLGGFYLDMYSRNDKFPGAWMDDFVSMMYNVCGVKQRPIAYLICNFNIMNDKECICLSHDEVSTLLHEFGHVLHHIMTIVDIPGVSGIHGVPLDAVEVPSQFMEKFCWDFEVLKVITSHFLTGESLSVSLINQLLKLKKYQSSYNLLYQLIYSIFDIRIYSEFRSNEYFDFMKIFNNIKEQLLIFPHMEWERFPHSFSHIFSCDYAAGYYSYLWSDMLASDIWYCFIDHGVLNSQIGKLFLNKILIHGGSEEFSDLFFSFCNKVVSTKCLLKYYYGM
ncbi:M3 family metallopeptidase [Blochmannia endosymbiont of Polyrhachis (Hedomyrma) turneri]|uniref:M3 family metallopeptidase n=1 Tax=Blochmannia endosymbiont of Polyrhachis (Hedomyrma) turneri TaxID=1505596 RepID=UPI00061A76E9|nr:M3 family metallopeptidase [Blochmannia endosymbiont of Polyrhachis (Hedomyrma) turneri]AKC59620.1 oligopeptidase A [Blochmannia endosymbiont of Polyrhachis (Hedomyrma) turneri]